MTMKYGLDEDENKSFDEDYTYCDQCEWNGISNQKIVVVYLGIRPVNEPGFIYKYETYDYSDNRDRKVHRHKYDPRLIGRLIDQPFDRNKRFVK
jgi:hypothetical protein